ncbi:hypothetical protein HGA88_03540 [Candidatus Roizmanbacteria bacterium]|nr:hypothetical protein [Candidatus Roizmanbacteria bacterium]
MQNASIPGFVLKYFWGDNTQDLHLQNNQNYIIQTILEKGDQEAVHWLFSSFGRGLVRQALPQLRLSKKSANFWNLYLS